jgi:hypothetical protein
MNKIFYLGITVLLLCILSVACGGNDNPVNEPSEPPVVPTSYIGYDSTYVPISSGDPLQDRLFYFATLLESSNYQKIEEQPEFKTLRERYILLLSQINDLTSLTRTGRKQFFISNAEGNSLATGFARAFKTEAKLRSMVDKELVPSGNWELYYVGKSDSTFLKRAMLQTVIAIDTIINQYLIGSTPQYPEDGPSDSDGPKNLYSDTYLQQIVSALGKIDRNNQTPLYLPVQTALALLRLNNRNEATRFEPLSSGENRAALANMKNIIWKSYTYASLIVPGDSPNSAGDAINLSESAKKHVQYAAQAYNEGLAPVIILSGANVYPYYPPTSYFEAVEMKKYMIQTYSIPDNVILIDPCARHTTTNLRNAARLIIKSGIPRYKKSLIVTTKSQNDIIQANSFTTRCNNELGYFPGTLGNRIADVRLEFTPSTHDVLTINASDPLDP